MSSRDRKLLTILAPVAAFALYWMLLMSPAMDRRAALAEPLAQAESARQAAVTEAAALEAAEQRYQADYDELVKLAKAIPQHVAVADLMRELNAAAKGTGIDFTNISMSAPAPDQQDADASSEDPSGAAGLDEIPVSLTFDGRFFQLADLFHSLQRFVTVADGKLQVHGRLIRIDSFSFESAAFPNITANVGATVYAAPASEGPTGGATPVGPPGAERGDGGLKPVDNFSAASVVAP